MRFFSIPANTMIRTCPTCFSRSWGYPFLNTISAWVAACTARETALERYAAALERGIVEDLTLADALRDQRRAHDAVVAAREAHAAASRRVDASAEGE